MHVFANDLKGIHALSLPFCVQIYPSYFSSHFHSYIHIFSSLSFQNLLSIQDHFYSASVISNVPIFVNTLPMIPFG